jgi:DNA-directed RNA polymerase specialized sigma24 family protein
LRTSDETGLVGWDGAFRTTHWTEILSARSEDEPRRRAALAELLGRYWKPVYCYLRSRGHAHETAKDLTQGFFHEVVLGKGLVQRAHRARGRFRTFLLKCLDRYVANVHRAEVTKQRMPEGGLVSLGEINEVNSLEQLHYTTLTEIFDYAWASALLDQVLAEVEEECGETGKATHWKVFQAKVLQPIMSNSAPIPLVQLCERYRISSEARASNMIITVKRRFQAILRRHVRQLVDSDAEVYEEIRHLMRIFSTSRAGS